MNSLFRVLKFGINEMESGLSPLTRTSSLISLLISFILYAPGGIVIVFQARLSAGVRYARRLLFEVTLNHEYQMSADINPISYRLPLSS